MIFEMTLTGKCKAELRRQEFELHLKVNKKKIQREDIYQNTNSDHIWIMDDFYVWFKKQFLVTNHIYFKFNFICFLVLLSYN